MILKMFHIWSSSVYSIESTEVFSSIQVESVTIILLQRKAAGIQEYLGCPVISYVNSVRPGIALNIREFQEYLCVLKNIPE
jgi:hypothetical protein